MMGIFSKLFGPTKRQREMAAQVEREKQDRIEQQRRRDKALKILADERHAAVRRNNQQASSAPLGADPVPVSDWDRFQSPAPSHHAPAVSGHGGTFDGGGSSGDWSSSSSSASDSGSSSSDSGSSSSDSGSSSSSD